MDFIDKSPSIGKSPSIVIMDSIDKLDSVVILAPLLKLAITKLAYVHDPNPILPLQPLGLEKLCLQLERLCIT